MPSKYGTEECTMPILLPPSPFQSPQLPNSTLKVANQDAPECNNEDTGSGEETLAKPQPVHSNVAAADAYMPKGWGMPGITPLENEKNG